MTAIPVLLADYVAEQINAASFDDLDGDLEVHAERSYPDWDMEFRDLGEGQLAVDVVYVSHQGGGGTIELDSASSLEYAPSVDVVVRRRFDPVDRDENGRLKTSSVDPLVELLQAIHEVFVGQRDHAANLAEGIDANWVDSGVMSWVNQWKLRQAGLFEGVIRINFTVSKVI